MTRKSQKVTPDIQPEFAPVLTLPETQKSAAPQDRKLLQEARAALSARSVPNAESAAEASPAETRNVNALLGLMLLGSGHPALEGQGLDLLERLSNVAVVTELMSDTGADHDLLAVTVTAGTTSRWNLDPALAALGQDDLTRLLRGLRIAARQGVTVSRGTNNDPLALEDQRLTWLGQKLSHHAGAGVFENLARTRPAAHPLNSGAGSAQPTETSSPETVAPVTATPATETAVAAAPMTASLVTAAPMTASPEQVETPAPVPVILLPSNPRRTPERAQTRPEVEQGQPVVTNVDALRNEPLPAELEAFGF